MNTSRLLLAVAILVTLATNIPAQDGLTIGPEAVPEFQKLLAARDITFGPMPPAPQADPTELINGHVVDPDNFPALLRMTTGGTCTGALVGQAALLTAAHCVDDGALIRFVSDDRQVRGLCEHAPGFAVTGSEDWALCLLEFPIGGIAFEAVHIGAEPTVGAKVHLTGFGCTFEDGPLDGRLRIGESELVQRPLGLPEETSTIYSHSSISAGGAVLCPGDSGGPLFVFDGDTVQSTRRIIGVNSRTTFEFGFSLFASTASAAGEAFFEDWTTRHNQRICGVNSTNSDSCK